MTWSLQFYSDRVVYKIPLSVLPRKGDHVRIPEDPRLWKVADVILDFRTQTATVQLAPP